MLSGLKGGLVIVSILLGALVLVEGVDRCLFRRRRVNECPEWREVTENVTKEYSCPCREAEGEDDSRNDDDGNWWNGWRRKRHTWSFRVRFTFGHWGRRSCWCQKEVPVTRYYCEKKCCEGWKRNRRNRCTIQIEDPEKLVTCDNGGTVTTLNGKQFCTCPPGFTGTVCETATCTRPCRNGGKCDDSLSTPFCVCQPDFAGEFCERPSCDCKNGGKCVANNYVAVCLCKEGFTGDKCQYIERNGTCPPPPPNSKDCIKECNSDGDCATPKKCCDSGCGRTCTLSEEMVCKYRGHKAQIGETFKPSPCEECTCVNPDPRAQMGGAICAVMDCPRIVNCSETITDPGKCCPRCAVPMPIPTDDPLYKEPEFRNCPKKLIVFDIGSDGTVVKLPDRLKLVAVTYKDVELKVEFSNELFRAARGDENFHSVIATSARDDRGNFARCKFFIRIRDPYPPKFDSCPADIDTQEGRRVEWDTPKASDNVGLIGKPTLVSRIPSGHIFPVGEHTVIYAIEDLEGNSATCDFIVSVFKSGRLEGNDNGDDGSDRPEKNKQSEPQSKLHAILIGACAALLFLIIVLVAAGCFFRQRRKKSVERRRRHHHHEHPHHHGHHHHPNDNGYDNVVYAIGGAHGGPPAYDNISVKEAPPKYSVADEYEKMSPPSGINRNAYDNVTYNAHGDDVSSVVENARNQAME